MKEYYQKLTQLSIVDVYKRQGPSIEKTGDLVAILTALEPGDVLFIDEIHRLNKVVEEILYPAMEDFCVDVVIGKEASTRSVRIDLPPFTDVYKRQAINRSFLDKSSFTDVRS